MPSSQISRSLSLAAALAWIAVATPAAAQVGTIQGKVMDSTGAVIPNVVITVDRSTLSATTGADGRYVIRGLPTGRQTVHAKVIRFLPATVNVEVKQGETVERDITLQHSIARLAAVEVVTGSHAEHTAANELAVPVDVYGSTKVEQQASTLTGEILAAMSPSINFPVQSVTDANDIVRPFTLRGLSPDHTLVLIDGWRRHSSALMNQYAYGMPAGSSGVDLNAIPSSAIDQFEVLRDGASSQYGSDAIAGVVNVKLKKGELTPYLNATAGEYYTGNGYPVDGQTIDLNGGAGFAVGAGSLAIFGEYGHHGATNRAWADPALTDINGVTDSVNTNNGQVVIKRNNATQPNYHWGDGLEDDGMLFGNFELPLGEGEGSMFYAFGGYSHRYGTGNGYFRYSLGNQSWTQIYPNGFLPTYVPDVQDFSVTGGVRTDLGGWAADFGLSYGGNSFDYLLQNTLNASLGPSLTTAVPGANGIPNVTTFNAGWNKRDMFEAGITLTKAMDMKIYSPVSLTVGALYRDETYKIIAGDSASWINGGANAQDGSGPAPAGSQVFPGFSPLDASTHSRTNIGVFGELEGNVSEQTLLNVAGRYENYSDFGSALTGKLAARWQPTSEFVVRGAVSTGFRAPGLPQSYFSHIATNYVSGVPVQVGIYPVSSGPAALFGAQPLKDETSVNLSAGVAYTPQPNFTMTLDGFYISITNRIMLGAQYSDSVSKFILDSAGYTSIGGVQYFSNGIDTHTAGVDFTGNLVLPSGPGTWNLNLDLNFTQNTITHVGPLPAILAGRSTLTSNIDIVTQLAITKERPDWRGILTGTYTQGRMHGLARVSYYGGLESAQPSYAVAESYPSRTLTDLEVGYQFTNVNLTIGSRNVFNIYPGRMWDPANNNFGVFPWVAASPFGYNGRFLYVQANMVLTH